MDLLEEFTSNVRNQRIIEEGDSILVALSGGPDSVALLRLLISIRDVFRLQISAAHINHKLRGTESDADQAFVEKLCRNWNIPVEVREAAVRRKSSGNIENKARKVRYDILTDLAGRRNALVATAHTQDDQAETFLMKLFRGAGASGLSGIFSKRLHRSSDGKTCYIIRPLLFVRKKQILEYLHAEGLNFRADQTNFDLTFDRNWVRHKLIPMIQQRLNPKLVPTLARTADLFGGVEEFLESEARESFETHSWWTEDDLVLETSALEDIHPAAQKQLVRYSIQVFRGTLQGLTMQHTEAVLDLVNRQSGREIHLPGGLRVIREFDELRFSTRLRIEDFCYQLKIPGELFLPEVSKKIRVRNRLPDRKSASREIRIPGDSVTVRNRRSGDRYTLSLEEQSKSLKKLFQERRVPVTQRAGKVILETDQGIVWVEGFPPNPAFQPGDSHHDTYRVDVLIETF